VRELNIMVVFASSLSALTKDCCTISHSCSQTFFDGRLLLLALSLCLFPTRVLARDLLTTCGVLPLQVRADKVTDMYT
jgi:hypothetical protein